MVTIKRGQYLIIRCNGEEQLVNARPTIAALGEAIGASTLDFFNLRDGRMVAVDDEGWETKVKEHAAGHIELVPTKPNKPVNEKATKLYHQLCIPGTTHQIVGDVAIVWDDDFA